VERLFQILKGNGRRPIGHPWHTRGRGLPDAAFVPLGFAVATLGRSRRRSISAWGQMRTAVQHVDLQRFGVLETAAFEPQRGPASVDLLAAESAAIDGSGPKTEVKSGVHELKGRD